MRFNKKKILLKISTIFLCYFIACTPQKRFVVLSFLFDGVPQPISTDSIRINDSLNNNKFNNSIIMVNSRPAFSLHKPYANRECNSCHTKGSMGELKQVQPDLCYQCHENMNETYASLHGPVQGGYCTACHSPHKTKTPHLLVNKEPELCNKCHSEITIIESPFHTDIGTTNCTNCHNPHGGDNSYNLAKGSCLNCHEDFNKSYSYLHGPVASDYCNVCHDSHASRSENLLLRPGQELCTYCHSETLITKNETHEDIADTNCTECHNPHGGEDHNLFN